MYWLLVGHFLEPLSKITEWAIEVAMINKTHIPFPKEYLLVARGALVRPPEPFAPNEVSTA